MTCIVAIAEEGNVYMGADSAGVGGLDLTVRRDPKIYRVGEFLFGFTTSYRMGQILGYDFEPPKHHPDIPMEKYMVTVFLPKIREALKAGGFTKVDNNVESGGRFIVGYRGRIFCIDDDFQVGEPAADFYACGCGAPYALGSLASSCGDRARDRLRLALSVSERFSAGVRAPFIFEDLKARAA